MYAFRGGIRAGVVASMSESSRDDISGACLHEARGRVGVVVSVSESCRDDVCAYGLRGILIGNE